MNGCYGAMRKSEPGVLESRYGHVIPIGYGPVENLCGYVLVQMQSSWDSWNVVG